METTQILITVPTLNEVFGWLVFYLCIGNVVSVVGCFGLVQSDYGRGIRHSSVVQVGNHVIGYTLFWPVAFGEIRDSYSYRAFNRDYRYFYR